MLLAPLVFAFPPVRVLDAPAEVFVRVAGFEKTVDVFLVSAEFLESLAFNAVPSHAGAFSVRESCCAVVRVWCSVVVHC